jgi:hypothetical protein
MTLGSQPSYVGQPIPKTTPLKPDAVQFVRPETDLIQIKAPAGIGI